MNHTRTLAKFAHRLSFEDIPELARWHVKRALLDTLGCTLGGAHTQFGEAALAVARTLGGHAQAQVIGHHDRSSLAQAAYVNALAANALDYDDGWAIEGKGMGHPSSSLVCAALAVAEWRRASGAELLTALTAAYEACNRVGYGIVPTPGRHAKVWGVALHQAFGAAVASARLMDLEWDTFLSAFGLAGAFTTLPAGRKWNFTDRPLFSFKDVVAPAAEGGLRAALYAEQGFQGSTDILDGDQGFWIMAGSDRCQFERLTKDLGSWWTMEQFYIKPYPACRWVHAALEACEKLTAAHGIRREDIAEIRVGSFADMARSFNAPAPLTPPDGQFSMPYTVAALVSGVPIGPQWYHPSTLRDPDVLALARKVKLHVDEEAEARHFSEERKTMSVVTFVLADGRELTERVAVARGGAENPLSQEAVEEKYRSQAEPVLGEARAARVLEEVMHIEQLADVAELAGLLTPEEELAHA